MQVANANPLPVPESAPSDALVESGPVVYEEDPAEEEEEEDEDGCVSAMDLMGASGQFRLV